MVMEGTRAMADSCPPVELDQALARVGGDRAFYRELLDMLLADAPGQVAEIAEALATGDASRVERAAHSLKGAAANLAAGPTRDAAAELESMGETGDLANAAGVLSVLARRLDELASYADEIG
jgi:HPt (histidine-containing phosphotransfer) domain-containing protein